MTRSPLSIFWQIQQLLKETTVSHTRCSSSYKMPKSNTQDNQPPQGYPTENPPTTGKKCCPRSKNKGDRGFIEGCLFALCCCWLCEACF